jgi:small subunit ribosomal protein S1
MTSPVQDTTPIYDMAELLDSVAPVKPLRRGDIVEGLVMRADPDGIFVNIGHKAEGVVPPGEMRTLSPEDMENLKVGDPVVTFVVRNETADQGAILSIDKAVGEQGWHSLEKIMEDKISIEGTIIGFNRGGAIVEAEGVQGFVPMSQLVSVSRAHFRETQEPKDVVEPAQTTDAAESHLRPDGVEQGAEEAKPVQEEDGKPLQESEERDPRSEDIGKTLTLKVLEVNRGRNRAIFSERQAVQEKREEQKARLILELNEDEVRHGRVTGISNFGAFVDLGGADGLIHISELSWNPVNTPEEIVQVGQELDVYVLRVDAENKKIALSLRRLQPEPWDSINDRHSVGDIIDATVTKLTNFGAFARVEGDEGSVEGLIHISELTDHMINHPREVVREGDTVKLKILRIEPERRRLGLSLKQAVQEL